MKVVPLYTTNGDVAAYLSYPYIYDPLGEWIGFCTREREVYSVLGNYVGYLSDDQRVLCQRSRPAARPDLQPPPRPGRLMAPAMGPLAPMMRELTQSTVDVLLERPELLHTEDMGELRPDME